MINSLFLPSRSFKVSQGFQGPSSQDQVQDASFNFEKDKEEIDQASHYACALYAE